MCESNARLDGLFGNYPGNVFSVLIRKVGATTAIPFLSICLHSCNGKNFSTAISRSLIVGKKSPYTVSFYLF